MRSLTVTALLLVTAVTLATTACGPQDPAATPDLLEPPAGCADWGKLPRLVGLEGDPASRAQWPAVERAVAEWNRAAGQEVFRLLEAAPQPRDRDVTVRVMVWPDQPDGSVGTGWFCDEGVVFAAVYIGSVEADWYTLSDLVMHELGHTLGVGDSLEEGSIMNPAWWVELREGGDPVPSAADAEAAVCQASAQVD
jgi:hypothetical protein